MTSPISPGMFTNLKSVNKIEAIQSRDSSEADGLTKFKQYLGKPQAGKQELNFDLFDKNHDLILNDAELQDAETSFLRESIRQQPNNPAGGGGSAGGGVANGGGGATEGAVGRQENNGP